MQCAADLFYHLLQGLCALKQTPQPIQPKPLQLIRKTVKKDKGPASQFSIFSIWKTKIGIQERQVRLIFFIFF